MPDRSDPNPTRSRSGPGGGARRARAALAAASALLGLGSTTEGYAEGGGARSDLLIVLDDAARPDLYQHTLSSEGAIVRLELPESARTPRVRFAGPERATFAEAHRRAPDKVTLWSGSVSVRYGEGGDIALVPAPDGTVSISASSVPRELVVEDGELVSSSLAWVFPESLELVSYGSGEGDDGRWGVSEGLLTYEHPDGERIELDIVWRPRERFAATRPDPCERTLGPGETCAQDTDRDGVPDHRDVCSASIANGAGPTAVDALGCAVPSASERARLRLDGVTFSYGQSYLDLDARRALDRLARALEHEGEGRYEIAAHTDGAGSRAGNLGLSEARAKAVRHYLMLRGIGPNRLRARGYGETRPLAAGTRGPDDATNRRIELERLD